MIVGVDKNQLVGNHGLSNRRKHSQMERNGAVLIPLRIPFGDYIRINSAIQDLINQKGADEVHKSDLLDLIELSIDTKKGLQEVIGNVCSKQHERFKRELLKTNGRLILLIEEPGIETLEDVYFWDNPRLEKNPKATKGSSLYKSLCTIEQEYGVRIYFCDRKDSGNKILELLEGEQK